MGWYEDHLKAVRRRWQKKKKEAADTEKFMESARAYLLGCGWTEQEVERILK